MATLSMVRVAELAYDAGLRNPVKLAVAVAVADAESGRNPDAIGDVARQDATWGPSVGLWQIRSLKAERGKGTIRDADALRNPAHNARAMVAISKSGADWSPWSVTKITSGAGFLRYRAALPLAQTAVAQMLAQRGVSAGAEAVQEAAESALQPIEKLTATISDAVQTPARILNWLTEAGTWSRIGIFVMGMILAVGGMFMASQGNAKTMMRQVVGKAVTGRK